MTEMNVCRVKPRGGDALKGIGISCPHLWAFLPIERVRQNYHEPKQAYDHK